MLSGYRVRATWFTLGWIAERFPEIVKSISDSGHEIASAGFWGVDRRAVTQAEFREDMHDGKLALEAVTGVSVDGFRSIRRSFARKELWLVDLVAEEGYSYDSSLMVQGWAYPAQAGRGVPFARQTRHGPIHELPHSVASLLGYSVPIGGGNFLRQLPTRFTSTAFRRWIDRGDGPFMLYFHPWELDRDIPEVSAFDRITRIRQYRNLGKMADLIPRYLEFAPFGTARDYLGIDERPVLPKRRARRPQVVIDSPSAASKPIPVSIVIPCYNEEATVQYLRNSLEEVIDAAADRYDVHFIFVDDRSKDSTVERLRDTFKDPNRNTVIALEQNRGVSGAILAGIDAANTEIVCSMDADCSYDPLELLSMIEELDHATALVTASPYHEDGSVLGVPGWRLFLSRGLSGIYKLFLHHKLATYTSCFRVYRRSVVRECRPSHGDFRGIVELLARLDMAGHKIKEHPTTLQSRIFGFSKMKTLKTIRDHIGLLLKMGRYRSEVEASGVTHTDG